MADELYDTGIAIREAMWGPEGAQLKVDRATGFQREFEERVTRHCFGETWGRPGLDRRTRSMLTLGMLIAQGRAHEIRVHVHGAISNGVTKAEIEEVLLHASVYCGIPAAVEGFRNAQDVLDELGVE
jgi:4-carboxymuconolactone decarboxylase